MSKSLEGKTKLTKLKHTKMSDSVEMDDYSEHEVERIRAELLQEKQMKEMLEQSTAELMLTVAELEKRYDSVADDGNEWKTRFETQQELNQLLQKQILFLRERLEKTRENLKDTQGGGEMRSYDELSEASLRKLLKQLERDKSSLEGQLKDYEWRLDQESKAYHKANDERKACLTEIHQARSKLEQAKYMEKQPWNNHSLSPRDAMVNRGMNENVPDNHRILDPKKGPIRKTAAVKKLPKLKL
ncbi:coiled-coil domain-containing protein 169-like [Anneissia japonica]|uniref:coiled-coil domain-containing protein 169-like n=1 Tax=Anneissia japonica TaxID=1529436 RepID=UPI0014257FB5|nr:coiled-coil domain-containing protein 169-like [Anneissia japonica]